MDFGNVALQILLNDERGFPELNESHLFPFEYQSKIKQIINKSTCRRDAHQLQMCHHAIDEVIFKKQTNRDHSTCSTMPHLQLVRTGPCKQTFSLKNFGGRSGASVASGLMAAWTISGIH